MVEISQLMEAQFDQIWKLRLHFIRTNLAQNGILDAELKVHRLIRFPKEESFGGKQNINYNSQPDGGDVKTGKHKRKKFFCLSFPQLLDKTRHKAKH